MTLKDLLHNKIATFKPIDKALSIDKCDYIEYQSIPQYNGELIDIEGITYVSSINFEGKNVMRKFIGESNQLTKKNGVIKIYEVENAYYFMSEKGLYRVSGFWGQVGSCIFDIEAEGFRWITGYCSFDEFKNLNFEFKNPSYQEFGELFKKRREKLGLTLESAAESSGISANTLKRIESARFEWDINLHTKICDALHIKIMHDEIN